MERYMKKIIILFFLLFVSTSSFAVEVTEADLEGKWLIVKMDSMDVADMDDVWQFKNGLWTAISGGKALSPDKYILKGGEIDLGHTKIEILEFNGNSMKTKQSGFVYTLEKQ
jgi:hypothetical protein